jgi:carbonic anhydrase
MDQHPQKSGFESLIGYNPDRVQAVAVYCSDGRYGEQIDELLNRGLGLPRYDRLAVPGGAACLAGHFYTYREEEGVMEQLRFLVTVHKVRRVVLIAHQNCAYYTDRLQVAPLQLETKQHEDLIKAARRVQRFGRDLQIDVFFARLKGDVVCFESFGV